MFKPSTYDYVVGDVLLDIHDGLKRLKEHHKVASNIVIETDRGSVMFGVPLQNKMLTVVGHSPGGRAICAACYDNRWVQILELNNYD